VSPGQKTAKSHTKSSGEKSLKVLKFPSTPATSATIHATLALLSGFTRRREEKEECLF
jgi:hypothetical protein